MPCESIGERDWSPCAPGEHQALLVPSDSGDSSGFNGLKRSRRPGGLFDVGHESVVAVWKQGAEISTRSIGCEVRAWPHSSPDFSSPPKRVIWVPGQTSI